MHAVRDTIGQVGSILLEGGGLGIVIHAGYRPKHLQDLRPENHVEHAGQDIPDCLLLDWRELLGDLMEVAIVEVTGSDR